jgi:hypothetical protein
MIDHCNTIRVRRNGVAMILVLCLIATAAIMSWAMLSSASLQAQAQYNMEQQVQRSNLAESGLTLALHYLKSPAQSPVALVTGPHGDQHYPGQAELLLWADAPGKVAISVTNTASGKFRIESRAVVNDRPTYAIADVMLRTSGYKVEHGAKFNRDVSIPSNVQVTGPVTASGSVGGQTGNITGAITLASSAPVASPSAVRVLQETLQTPLNPVGANRRSYTWNGQQYQAQKLPFIVMGTLTPDASNPAGVWYADTGANLAFTNVTINGTIVSHSATWDVRFMGNCTVTPLPGMPAVVTNGDIDVCTTSLGTTRATLNGLVYTNGVIRDTGTRRTDGFLRINGSLEMASASATFDSTVRMPVEVVFDPARADVPSFLNTTGNSRRVQVISWNVD